MIRLLKLVACLLILLPMYVFPDVPPEQVREVKYLIEFITNTSCMLERNGKMYTGAQTIEHILRKYEYFRDKIKSTEDFIQYSASRSEITGKSYMAYCGDNDSVEGIIWLNNELVRYRKLDTD